VPAGNALQFYVHLKSVLQRKRIKSMEGRAIWNDCNMEDVGGSIRNLAMHVV